MQPKIEDIFNMIRINNFKNCILLLAVLFSFTFQISAQSDGAAIFKANCTACHMIGGGRLVGPDLQGITEKRTKDWLKKNNVKYDELIFGKPHADMYIDDLGLSFDSSDKLKVKMDGIKLNFIIPMGGEGKRFKNKRRKKYCDCYISDGGRSSGYKIIDNNFNGYSKKR